MLCIFYHNKNENNPNTENKLVLGSGVGACWWAPQKGLLAGVGGGDHAL